MALLFCDGFEYTAGADKWSVGGVGSQTTTQARTGSSSSGVYAAAAQYVPASGSTAIIGVGIYQTQTGNASLVGIYNGPAYYITQQCCVQLNSAQGFTAYRGSSTGTVLGSSSQGIVRLNQWNYVEVKFVLSQTVGTITVKLNGEEVLALTGLDNCYQANEDWNCFDINSASGMWLDDVYCCDGSGAQNNDFLGEIRIVSLLPSTGNGSNTDFTCSSSTDHGALVDDASPNDDTDYVYSSTLNHVDTWNFPALGYTGTIKGVQLNLQAKKTDSGTRTIAAVTRPASTNRVHGTDHYLGTGYISYAAMWELNPEDSAAWEVADVDGAEFGVKVTL